MMQEIDCMVIVDVHPDIEYFELVELYSGMVLK